MTDRFQQSPAPPPRFRSARPVTGAAVDPQQLIADRNDRFVPRPDIRRDGQDEQVFRQNAHDMLRIDHTGGEFDG